MRLMTRLRSMVAVLATVAVLPSAVLAQATGGMTGVVSDDSGAVVPGVTVEVINQGTGQTRVVVTGGRHA